MRVRLALITAFFLPLLFACSLRAQTTDPTVAAADAAYDAKRYTEAIPLYQKIVASKLTDEVRAHAQLLLGYCNYQMKETKVARDEWLALPDMFPQQISTCAEALLRAGNLSIKENDYPGAFSSFKRVSDDYAAGPEAAPFAAEAICRLGKVYLHQAEAAKASAPATEDGAKVWERAALDFELARQAFERVMKEFPGEWASEAEMQLIALKYEWAFNGRVTTYDEVIAAADRFLKQGHPNDVWRRPKVHLMKAEALIQQRKFRDAIPDLLIIREKYPKTATQALGTSRYFLARCYEETGVLEKAYAEYLFLLEGKEQSFERTSDHAAAEYGLANILKRQSRLEEAASWYARLKADHPNSHWSRFADEGLAAIAEAASR